MHKVSFCNFCLHFFSTTTITTNTTTNTIAPSPPKPSAPHLHQHLANQCLIETKELFLESCSTNFQLFPNFSTSFLGFFHLNLYLASCCFFFGPAHILPFTHLREHLFGMATDWFDFFTFFYLLVVNFHILKKKKDIQPFLWKRVRWWQRGCTKVYWGQSDIPPRAHCSKRS